MSHRAAQGLLLVGVVGGVALAWILHDWLDNCWEHCDFDGGECTDRWFPRAFGVSQYLWVAVLVVVAMAILCATLASWHKADLVIITVGWAVLLTAMGITPLHGGWQPLTYAQIENNPFLWDSHGYSYVGVAIVLASFALGAVLVRSVRPRSPRG